MSWLTDWSMRERLLLASSIGLAALAAMSARRAPWHLSRRKLVLDQIAEHRSIRNFKATAVPEELLQEILSTSMRSSNYGNMQTSSVIVTRDKQALRHLALMHDNSRIAEAPLLLTFVADWTKTLRWCELSKAEPQFNNFHTWLTGNNDAMVLAQTVALASEACGLGICFLGSTTFETDRLNKFFELPRGAHVITSIMLGYPDEAPNRRARLPAAPHIFNEKYTALTDQALLEHYASREEEGWNRYLQLYGPSWKQKLDSHDIKNLAQVYTTLKYSGSDCRIFSRRQLASLQAQGFMENEAKPGDGLCTLCGLKSHCLDPDRFHSASGSHQYS